MKADLFPVSSRIRSSGRVRRSGAASIGMLAAAFPKEAAIATEGRGVAPSKPSSGVPGLLHLTPPHSHKPLHLNLILLQSVYRLTGDRRPTTPPVSDPIDATRRRSAAVSRAKRLTDLQLYGFSISMFSRRYEFSCVAAVQNRPATPYRTVNPEAVAMTSTMLNTRVVQPRMMSVRQAADYVGIP